MSGLSRKPFDEVRIRSGRRHSISRKFETLTHLGDWEAGALFYGLLNLICDMRESLFIEIQKTPAKAWNFLHTVMVYLEFVPDFLSKLR